MSVGPLIMVAFQATAKIDEARTASVLNSLKNDQSNEFIGEEILKIKQSLSREKLKFMYIDLIVYYSVKTLIKNVFLLNFA